MIRRGLLLAAATAALVLPSVPAQAGFFCEPGDFSDRATTRVDMKGDCFAPVVARVQPGDEVTFRNLDSHDHTVGGVAGTFGDGHEPIFAGRSVTFRFDEEGVFPFFCVVHPGMAGAVVVGDGSASGSSGAAAVPVEPASTARDTPPVSEGLPLAAVVAIGMAALVVAGIATTIALRRRRGLTPAA